MISVVKRLSILFGLCICFASASSLSQSSYKTSQWLDRDDPSGSGDWEQLSDFAQYQVGCTYPIGVNARTTDGVSFWQTGEKLTVSSSRGLVCENRLQDDKKCLDYEVRFTCRRVPWERLTGTWFVDVAQYREDVRNGKPNNEVYLLKQGHPDIEPSRAPQLIRLYSGNHLEVSYTGPADGLFWEVGTWTTHDSNNTIRLNLGNDKSVEILEAGYIKLKVKVLNYSGRGPLFR